MHLLEIYANKDGYTVNIDGKNVQDWRYEHNLSELHFACPMAEIPSGYRLVTDKDKAKPKPKGYQFLVEDLHRFLKGDAVGTTTWGTANAFIVPDDETSNDKAK